MSAEHELVFPAKGELETFGTEVGSVLLRSIGTIDCRKFITFSKHVLCVADISLTGELESTLEHIEVDADVPLL